MVVPLNDGRRLRVTSGRRIRGTAIITTHLLLNWNRFVSDLKKIVAILLLFVMVFNLVGYRWIFEAIEDKATADLEQKISTGEYSNDQLVEIRIPLNMPYYSDKDYENVYGETDW